MLQPIAIAERKPRPNAIAAQHLCEITGERIKMLRAFITKRVMNPDDVDDILQCVLLEALRSKDKFQNASKPETWLCGIAVNLVRNHFRKMYNQPYQESWEDDMHSDIEAHVDIGHHVDRHRQLTQVVHALGHLPSNMQSVIKVALEMDGNYNETAASLGVPIGTVRSRLSRARVQLKKYVDPFA